MGKTYCKNCDRLTEWTKDGLCPSCRRGEPPQSPDPRDERLAEMHKDSEYKWRETAEQLAQERDQARARVQELERELARLREQARTNHMNYHDERRITKRLQAEVERLKGTPIKVDYDGGVISVNGEPIADHSELPRVNERRAEENFRLREALEKMRCRCQFRSQPSMDDELVEWELVEECPRCQALQAHSPVAGAPAVHQPPEEA